MDGLFEVRVASVSTLAFCVRWSTNFAPMMVEMLLYALSFVCFFVSFFQRQAMDHVMWNATKLAVGVGVKSYFITAGFL